VRVVFVIFDQQVPGSGDPAPTVWLDRNWSDSHHTGYLGQRSTVAGYHYNLLLMAGEINFYLSLISLSRNTDITIHE